jgi:hypothetical protein
MTWGAVAGAAIGVVGGALNKPKAPKMPEYNPWSIQDSLFGDTMFDKQNKRIKMALSPTMQGFADYFTGTAGRYLGGNTPTSPFQQFAYNDVQGMIPGLFGGALDASSVDPWIYGRYDRQMEDLARTTMAGGRGATAGGLGILAGPAAGLSW